MSSSFETITMHAYQGNLDDVKRIVGQRPESIDYRCMGGDTALLLALRYRHLDIACFLVENGADVTRMNDKKENVFDTIFKHQNIMDMTLDMNLDMNLDMTLDTFDRCILQTTNFLLLHFLQQGIIPTPNQLFEIKFYAQMYNCSQLLSYFDHKERADTLLRFFKFNHTGSITTTYPDYPHHSRYPDYTKNDSEAVLHNTVFFIHHFMPYDLILELSKFLNLHSYLDSSLTLPIYEY